MVTMQTLIAFDISKVMGKSGGGGMGAGVREFLRRMNFFLGITLVRIFLGQWMNIFFFFFI